MKVLFAVFFFGSIFSFSVQSADVVIKGSHTDYANKELILYKYSDRITEEKVELATIKVDSSGSFNTNFNISNPLQVFIDIGIYRTYLFVEPEMTYTVILPEYVAKTKAEELNPYFSPTNIHLATTESEDKELNMQIRMFEDDFQPYLNKHIQHILVDSDFSTLNKDLQEIEKKYKRADNEYFNNYRIYRYGFLRYIVSQKKSKNISDDLFTQSPVLYENMAYWDLFNKVFEEYFSHVARTPQGKRIGRDITVTQNIDSLRQTLKADGNLLSDNLIDLVILKGLYKEFYDDNYSRSALLKILEGLIENAGNNENKYIAQIMHNKVTKLLVGFEPPHWELFDLKGDLVKLEKFKGKHVYLNFCSCFSYSCLSEFAQLKLLYDRHRKYLEIVSIIVDDDLDRVNDLVKRSGYKWTFLHYGNHVNVLTDYDIRAYPTYYLIDREGNLVQSPAPTPNDQFEISLFKILKADGVL